MSRQNDDGTSAPGPAAMLVLREDRAVVLSNSGAVLCRLESPKSPLVPGTRVCRHDRTMLRKVSALARMPVLLTERAVTWRARDSDTFSPLNDSGFALFPVTPMMFYVGRNTMMFGSDTPIRIGSCTHTYPLEDVAVHVVYDARLEPFAAMPFTPTFTPILPRGRAKPPCGRAMMHYDGQDAIPVHSTDRNDPLKSFM